MTLRLVALCALLACFFLANEAEARRKHHKATEDSENHSCGKKRWGVKTGTDPDARKVDLAQVKDISIKEMSRWHNPIDAREAAGRQSPQETTVWRVKARLVGYKVEDDSDYHVVVEDSDGNTMIVEFPSPDCVGDNSPFKQGIALARQQFDSHFAGKSAPNGHFRTLSNPPSVEVTGVGFFDFIHGQKGVAPNGVEIHPVLDVKFR